VKTTANVAHFTTDHFDELISAISSAASPNNDAREKVKSKAQI
jgi:hypothetical protein